MRYFSFILICVVSLVVFTSCKESGASNQVSGDTAGLKIAFVNGDSILLHYKEFRKESEAMELKQKNLEQELQSKGAELEKEIRNYQQKAQTGTMTGKEMEAREKYLATRQESLLAERDRMAQEIMKETGEINKRLQSVIQDKLNGIKAKEGYDFILSYIDGGQILVADEKFDITDRVLRELNAEESTPPAAADTSSKK